VKVPPGYGTDEVKWIELKWALVRESSQLADEANKRWKRINAEINKYMDDSGVTDIVQRNKIKSESLPLKDALAVGKWHSENAQRHIDDVQLFIKMKEVGLL
jgi:hypothetical protein